MRSFSVLFLLICRLPNLSAFYDRPVTAREIILDSLEEEGALRGHVLDRNIFPLHSISFREPILNTEYHKKIYNYLFGECLLSDLEITTANCKLWLYAAKDLDIFFYLHPDTDPSKLMNTTFAIRYCCLTVAKEAGIVIETTEAFSINNYKDIFEYHSDLGKVITTKRNNLINLSRSSLLYIPEWANRLQKTIQENIKGFFELNKMANFLEPKVILLRGCTGSGKSYQLINHPLLLPYALHLENRSYGIFSTDNLKRIFLKLWTDMTREEIHTNLAALNQELSSITFRAYPEFTFIHEGWFRRFSLIQEILSLLENYSKTTVQILDIDTPLKICAFRTLYRASDKASEKPGFLVSAFAFDEIRRMRLELIEKIMMNDRITYYELITGAFRDRDQIVISWKTESGLLTSSQNLLEFSQAISQYNEAEIEQVAEHVISISDYIEYGHFLQPFLGMKMKDAINKIAN